MSEKLSFREDEAAPPYSDSISSPNTLLSPSENSPLSPLQAQRATARALRIQNLLTMHIESAVHAQLLEGINKRTFLVLPSDVLTQQPHLTSKDVVSLPAAANASVMRLKGEDDRATFWQQKVVLQDLASALRARLAASGHKVENNQWADPAIETLGERQQQAASPSWLKKRFGTPGPEHDPTATTNYKLGWRADGEDASQRKLDMDEIRVLIRFRDVSFRFETEMGLLDSAAGGVVLLEVEVGT